MPISEKRQYEVFAFMILFLVLNFQTCYGNYTCYPMSSGKDICFMLDASQQTFEKSKHFCQNNGGFLLEIYNLEMQRLVEQFGKNKTTYLGNAWLNLVLTTSKVWVWGGEASGRYLTYSNWETSNPLSSGINIAFMNFNYKWINTYNPLEASTICIKGNPATYSSETSTITTTSTTTTTTTPSTPSSLSSPSQSSPPPTTTTQSSSSSSSSSSSTTTQSSSSSSSSSAAASSSSSSASSSTTTQSSSSSTSTIIPIIQPTQITATYTITTSSSAVGIGIGVGVGLGGLVLIIVSSLLIAKFVFHKEIPLPFKSSRGRNSPLHETGSDVTDGGYMKMDKNILDERSAYAEVMMSDTPTNLPPNSTLNYIGFQDMNIQPNSASGLEGLSKTDYGTPQTFGKIIYDNAV